MVALKNTKIWVCFKLKDSKDGRKGKIPCSAEGTATGTSANYAHTWVTYDEALAAARQNGYDGVGFVVPSGFFFLDIDHRKLDDPFVQNLLKRFNTYTEYSVSGEGLHLYGKCDISRIPVEENSNGKKLSSKYYSKNPKNGIELYIGGLTNRFALFTGNVISGSPVTDCTDAVLSTLETDMRRTDPGRKETTVKSEESWKRDYVNDTEAVIDALRKQKNGSKFSSLFDRGEISGYRSHSEADAALCSMIAFRVGNNPGLIDRVFRKSALYRKKWERNDYRENTIKVGVDACHGTFYSPGREKHYENNSIPRTQRSAVHEGITGVEKENLKPADYSDVGQATVFAKQYGARVRYSAATEYLVYDGTVWKESAVRAQGLSQELTERQLEEAGKMIIDADCALNAAVKTGDEKQIQIARTEQSKAREYQKYVISRRKTERIRATLTEARPKVEIAVSELDADGYILNTPSGAVDLRSGEIKPNKPEDNCTRITSVAPDTTNQEIFTDFIRQVTCGDESLAQYLQEVAGMCAVGRVLQENLIIVYGEGGNGKSTLFNLLSRVLGDYAGALSAETLTSNCRKNRSPEYAELRGKRLVIAAELEEGMRLNTAVVKKLCSTDPIIAEKKFKDPFTFVPSHTVILYTNHLPKVGTTDRGTWDRIITVPFNAKFRNSQGEIKNMTDYLFEKCAGAVLTWIISGAKRFINNGHVITLPDCVRESNNRYKADSDWFNEFLVDNCEVDKGFCEKSGDLYAQYRNFCEVTGEYKRSLADFKKALNTHGFLTRRTNKGSFITGLRLLR